MTLPNPLIVPFETTPTRVGGTASVDTGKGLTSAAATGDREGERQAKNLHKFI
jgi:hypothetical protein